MSGVSSLVYRILCQDDLAGGLRANCSHIYVLIKKTNNIECLIENLVNLARTGESKVFMQFMEKFSKILEMLGYPILFNFLFTTCKPNFINLSQKVVPRIILQGGVS